MWNTICYCKYCGHQLILVNGTELFYASLECPDCKCETPIFLSEVGEYEENNIDNS
jgi:hypothetical protein